MLEDTTMTVGVDLGDRRAQFCILDQATGEIREEGKVMMTPVRMEEFLSRLGTARVVLEAGPQSAWVTHLGEALGHEVVVAQPSKFRAIYTSDRKSDRADARMLAKVGRMDPTLLHPVKHRGVRTQGHRAVVRSRDALVRARTLLVNQCRGTVKVFGERVSGASTEAFPKRCRKQVTVGVREALEPVLEAIEAITLRIRHYDKEIARLCEEEYPETGRLMQVSGVGELTALDYVLTIEDPHRFRRSRDVGPYLGLVPRRDQSGAVDRQLRITKAGDVMLRRLLVGSAQFILGPFGPDTTLRRWGLTLASRGGGNGKRRAVVAVARKLATLLHRLWVSGEKYEPLRGCHEEVTA